MTPEHERKLVKQYPWLIRSTATNPRDMFGMECGDGWYELINELCFQIDRALTGSPDLKKDFSVSQIKEKFGGLRFYISYGTDEIYALINAAEEKSTHTCETCGRRGKIHDSNGWLTCECVKCKKVRLK